MTFIEVALVPTVEKCFFLVDQVLIEEGADLHETDENGKKAVDLAEENRFPDVACALLEAAGDGVCNLEL